HRLAPCAPFAALDVLDPESGTEMPTELSRTWAACWMGPGRAPASARPPKRASAPAVRVAAILGRRSRERPARRRFCGDRTGVVATALAMTATVSAHRVSSWGVGGLAAACRSTATPP